MSDKNKRPILKGYMVLDEWAEDYSHWDGNISYPNPEGANLYWSGELIPMIEQRAYDTLRTEADKLAAAIVGLQIDAIKCAEADQYIISAWAKQRIDSVLKDYRAKFPGGEGS